MSASNGRLKRGEVDGMDSIDIMGPFDFSNADADVIVENLIAEGKRDIVFNFSQVTYLTSTGIACIIKTLKKIQAVNGRLFVAQATEDMRELLDMAYLGKYLTFI